MISPLNAFIIVPLLAIIGIILIGSIIEDILGVPHATEALFIAVGGIWFFAKFFLRG